MVTQTQDTKRRADLTATGEAVEAPVSDDRNSSIAGWEPSIFFRNSATGETEGNESEHSDEEDQWAALAARARKDWAEENPY